MVSYESDVMASSDAVVSMVLGVMAVLSVVLVVIMVFAILCYVLQSLGMYTIAKRREIKYPWMAWIPVVNVWTLGSIDDQYQYVANGKVTNRRKWLLGLGIVTCVLGIASSVIGTKAMLELASLDPSLYSMSDEEALNEEVVRTILPIVSKMVGVSFFMMVFAIVQTVFQYIALYGLYASCDPNNKVMYLVLSIVFSVTIPFFVVACRNKDLGMPPRRGQIPEPQMRNDPWETNQ